MNLGAKKAAEQAFLLFKLTRSSDFDFRNGLIPRIGCYNIDEIMLACGVRQIKAMKCWKAQQKQQMKCVQAISHQNFRFS